MRVEATIGTPVLAAASAVRRSPWPSGSQMPMTPTGASSRGVGQLGAEQRHGQVALGATHEHAGHQAPAVEGLDVRPLGVLVTGTTGHVGQQLLAHLLFGPALPVGERHRQVGPQARQPVEVDRQLPVPVVRHAAEASGEPSLRSARPLHLPCSGQVRAHMRCPARCRGSPDRRIVEGVRSPQIDPELAMSDVVVLGAGLIGLQTAMLLAEDGHRVAVLERDPTPPPLRIDRAWSDWSRPGVRQFGYAHFLMARWRAEADRHLPAVTEALGELGALRANVFENHPLRRGRLRDGDEQFEILTARRPVIELAVARTADATPGVTVCRGVAVQGVVGTTGPDGTLHVTGVSTDGGIVGADLVVDCGGRQSSMPRWIRDAGGPAVVETREDVGFRYYSRHFRSRDGRQPAGWGATAAPHDSLTVLTLPADNGTWSVVFTTSSEDRELPRPQGHRGVGPRQPVLPPPAALDRRRAARGREGDGCPRGSPSRLRRRRTSARDRHGAGR